MRAILTLGLFLLASLTPLSALAAERVALVIGMGAYISVPALKNTTNDANALSEALTNIGFDVTTLIDIPQQALVEEMASFAFRAETADLALIYFAGHGVELQGRNFLIPVDAAVASNRDLLRYSVSLDDMLAAVDGARKMRIVILDSCRDNPFGDFVDASVELATTETATPGTDTGTRGRGGLAPATPDRGTLVAFAAKDGQVALDGKGDNSPFATALVKNLTEPGLEIGLAFRKVRDQVMAETGNRQEPFTYGSLPGTYFHMAGSPEELAVNQSEDRPAAWSDLRPEQADLLKVLAESGDTRSMLGLAYMRLNPADSAFDPVGAADYFTRAAASGSPEAQFELAKLYEGGIGVPQDTARALELYRASADQDFADAINDLGFLTYQGALGLVADPAAALIFFERAADLKHPEAMYNYAALIDDGAVAGKGPDDAAGYLYQALRSGSKAVLTVLTENPDSFKIETRKALQVRLADVSFYAGTIDGDFGPGTLRSIRTAYGLTDGAVAP